MVDARRLDPPECSPLGFPDLSHLLPECRVSVGGQKLALDDDARLTRVEIELDVDLFGHGKLVFHDPRMELINSSKFQSGTEAGSEGEGR